MNFKKNESAQKLSGSYYTPSWLAGFICRWVLKHNAQTVLEPSCGDGVFFETLSSENTREMDLYAFDINGQALEDGKNRIKNGLISTKFFCMDFLEWAIENKRSSMPVSFDAVVGNPPFIRYQYLEKEQQERAQELFALMGMSFTKHTNAWIPFVISSVEFLRPGGVIGMVIPSEILNVLYASGLREYLLKQCSKIMLIDPEDLWFESTLQGVMLLIAQKKTNVEEKSSVAIIRTQGTDFSSGDPDELFRKADFIDGNALKTKWTYALMTKHEFDAFVRVRQAKKLTIFKKLADVDVGIVTGANKFFLVADEVVKKYGLHAISHPMFGRSEHCPGVLYDEEQHKQNSEKGLPTNFLYFEQDSDGDRYMDYLETGVAQEIPARYKCRIRTPWYKVPSVYASPIGMLKRSNGMPRLILNTMNAYTTDTAYRISPQEGIIPAALVRCFLNTITALSAELEGRFYGGGVLELVPSEIERLVVPYTEYAFTTLDALNQKVKTCTATEVLASQDMMLFSSMDDIDYTDISLLQNALLRIQKRRQRINDTPDETEPMLFDDSESLAQVASGID